MRSTTPISAEIKSLAGNEYHTPSSFNNGGRMNRKGSKQITCRDRLIKIDFVASPSDWKKLVVTIWKPATQNTMLAMRNACAVVFMRPSSVVNIRCA